MAKRWAILVLSLAIIDAFCIANAEVPAIFILGDSTADVGTNNFLPGSRARADFPFNGIDFPYSKPTGRFSNGFNSADFLAMLMGYKSSPPPYLSLNIQSALKNPGFKGINFASGGSGLLDITGSTLSLMKFGKESSPLVNNQQNVVSLREQIEEFALVHSNLSALYGPAATQKFLSKSLFFISIGSNDIFGYYHSKTSTPKQDFISMLGSAYETHLKNLINLGARKFGIISVPPIGCCPSQRVFNASGGCLEELNDYARAFHSTMGSLMCKLSSEHAGVVYSLGNSYEMTINVLNAPLLFNFTEVQTACCGEGKLNAESFCSPKAKLCSNRENYLFWDLFHPTQTASKLAAVTLYGGGLRFVTPMNFSQLAEAN